MGLTGLLGLDYQPTAAFSFEFIDKKSGNQLAPEIFFLLPPEEYSLQEGYRVTVNKTAGGGWVDDFGNDFKKIRISGSLYAFYQGYPSTYSSKNTSGEKDKWYKKVGNAVKTAGGQALASVTNLGKGLASSIMNEFAVDIPGISALSGLEEFFRLRYLVARFRDRFGQGKNKYSSKPLKQYKDIVKIISSSAEGKVLFDNVAIVYHDYDDSNHYEVVFDNFTMSRSKDDPFTIHYNIEMTGLREIIGNYFNATKKSVGKENPNQVVAQFNQEFSNVLTNLKGIANIPREVAKTIQSVVAGAESFANLFTDFTTGVASDWKQFSSAIDGLEDKTIDAWEALYIFSYGETFDTLLNETNNLTDPNDLSVEKALEQNYMLLEQMRGTEKYYSNEEQQRTMNVGNQVINDTDFNADQESSSDNLWVTQGKTYYEVQQGDTLLSIANKFYGDFSFSTIIGQANDITHKDFENNGMVGKNIIIPLQEKVVSSVASKNLVYFKKLSIATPDERRKQILGADFSLSSNRQILADGTGDIAMIFGDDCYLENINDRLKYEVGVLSPIHPGWGVALNIGVAPASILVNRILGNIEEQISLDPRTEYGFVDRDNPNFDLTGDTLKIPVNLKPHEGVETTIDAGSSLPGSF